ncbi:MAG: tetratricopeptide repeat protein, partial [Sphingobacteriaceae bacterium]
VRGIGYYYANETEKSVKDYLIALDYFNQIGDLQSEAKVNNNIGNLYRDVDYEQSLIFFNLALDIAKKLNDKQLIASLYLNIGNVNYRQKKYHTALGYYDKSHKLFEQLGDSINIIHCVQNRGVIYYNLHQYAEAEVLLLQANREAKARDLNEIVASVNLTLASLYIAQNEYDNAERVVEEGRSYADLIKDKKLTYDYQYTSYQMEFKRKNFEKALQFLRDIYKQDSTIHKTNESSRIKLMQEQSRAAADKQRSIMEKKQYENDRIKFFGVTIVSGLLLVVVVLLIGNVKRKAKTNAQLTELNGEVSRQKDNLDRINHHLEEIIDERTRDLQVKNKKLSEYSSYLSHQIRGPIATLKGLMNLEKEGLVDQDECIKMMDKCVTDIDSKIIEMSDMLHGPVKADSKV